MWTRILIPVVAVFLFLMESEFALFSPISFGEETFILVPRFTILYLIFLAIYYNWKRAMIYGLIFGLLFDVFYINIIGLYTVLYPLMCFIAAWSAKRIHTHLVFSTILAILLMGFLECVLYEFFFLIDFTTMPREMFLLNRLVPTILANLLFLLVLGWAFKYLIRARVLRHAQHHS